jgi:uncharacterized protein (DUF433 family)
VSPAPGRRYGLPTQADLGGQPTVAERGVRVADIVNRLNAQEPAKDVAGDYDVTLREVQEIRRAA